MRNRKRWGVAGGLAAVGTTLALVVGLGAGAGTAAVAAAPQNTAPPTITGTPQEGQKLVGPPGHVERQCGRLQRPVDALRQGRRQLRQHQRRQRRHGYTLKNVDVGNTIRFKVYAKNADGTTTARLGTDRRDQARYRSAAEARIKRLRQSDQRRSSRSRRSHHPPASSSTRHRSRQARSRSAPPASRPASTSSPAAPPSRAHCVYVTAVPYNQFSIPNEQPTGSDGWATLQMNKLGGFPATQSQQLLVMFVRARKSGEPTPRRHLHPTTRLLPRHSLGGVNDAAPTSGGRGAEAPLPPLVM